MRTLLPFLPYRQPKVLKNNQQVGEQLQNLGAKNVLFVTDKSLEDLGLTQPLKQTLNQNNINVFVYDGVVPNPTTKNVAEALDIYNANNCQAIIGFGGGSSMDCAKAVGARVARPNKQIGEMKGILKVRKSLPPLFAVPTTAGTGSETTLAAVICDEQTRHKYAINDFPLIPKYALLDASLTVGLPKHITSTTGMDALTHAVEAYIGKSTTKQTRRCSLRAIKMIFENLPEVYQNPQNLKARENMLEASYLAGLAFTKSYVGYVHALAHALGGKYNTPHGLANAVLLPYVLKSYGKKIAKKLWKIGIFAEIFDKNTPYGQGAQIVIEKIEELNNFMQIPKHLEINKQDIAILAKTAEHEANPLYPVPVLWGEKQLMQIYSQVANIENLY